MTTPSQAVAFACREGRKDMARELAVWRDGEQFVGVTRTPLKTILRELDEEPLPAAIEKLAREAKGQG